MLQRLLGALQLLVELAQLATNCRLERRKLIVETRAVAQLGVRRLVEEALRKEVLLQAALHDAAEEGVGFQLEAA